MVSQGRAERVAQRVQEELSELLIFDISDPRLSGVYVTHVRVDRELNYANIFVSALEGAERKDEIIEGLQSASGFIRSQLARRINLRSFPNVRFYWDPMPEDADRIDKLIASLSKKKDAGEEDA